MIQLNVAYELVRAERRLVWPRRARARLRVQPRYGKRWTFSDLRPTTAAAIAGHVRAGLPVPSAIARATPG